MRKFFIVSFLLFCCLFAYSEEKKTAIGLGIEVNMDSRHLFALGAVLGINYNITEMFAMGLSVEASTNFDHIRTIEPMANIRLYFYENNIGNFFGQVDMGAFFFYEDGYDVYPMPLFGVRAGFRRTLGPLFYLEPSFRAGYPFALGLELMAGIRL